VGLFITFEGPEGSGKSTQAQRLYQRLIVAGQSAVLTKEPGGTLLGEGIRDILLHDPDLSVAPEADVLLFAADRAQHVSELVRPHLEQGFVVICDRFTDSTLAYQGWGYGLDIEQLKAVNAFATGGLTPDLTVLLDLPVEAGLARKGTARWDRFENQENVAFHERVRTGYLELAQQEPQRFLVVDGRGTEGDIEDIIWNKVEEYL